MSLFIGSSKNNSKQLSLVESFDSNETEYRNNIKAKEQVLPENMTPFYKKMSSTTKKVKDFIYYFQCYRQPSFIKVGSCVNRNRMTQRGRQGRVHSQISLFLMKWTFIKR